MRKILISICFALMLLACETELVYEPEVSSPMFVLYSFLQNDSVFAYHVSKTATVNSSSVTYLADDGIVSIYANDLLINKVPYYSTSNWVQISSVKLIHSMNYHITYESQDLTLLSAESSVPKPTNVLGVDTISTSQLLSSVSDTMVNCEINFKDSIGVKNYYQLAVKSSIIKNGDSTWQYSDVDFLKSDDLFFTSIEVVGGLGSGIDFDGLFTDNTIDGRYYRLKCQVPKEQFYLKNGETTKKVEFILYSLSYEYYQYYMSRKYIDGYSGIPFLNPVISYSNVSNGLGCVGGLSSSSFFVEAK